MWCDMNFNMFRRNIFRGKNDDDKENVLNDEIMETIAQMEIADVVFDNSLDHNFIDSALYSRQSCERRLVHLIELARRQKKEHLDAKSINDAVSVQTKERAN